MRTILVTGGTGLVGSAIREVVEAAPAVADERWVFAGSRDADLADPSSARAYFERVRPTHVIHCAAKLAGMPTMIKANVEFFRDNMEINKNVLDMCAHVGVQRVVSCMSTVCFSPDAVYPVDESALHFGLPHAANIGYGYSKRMAS